MDLLIVPDLGYGNDKVSYVRISDGVKLVFFASLAHPIFKKEPMEWSDICDYPLLVGHEPLATKRVIPNKLLAEGVNLPLNQDFTANNIQFCKILVQNGKYISVALKEDIKQEVDAVAYRGMFTTPIVQSFISSAKATFY